MKKTRAEKIFLERLQNSIESLQEWQTSPNLTPFIQDCLDKLSELDADINIEALLKFDEE